MILTKRKEQKRFMRFLVVGLIGFVVDFGTFNLLHTLIGLEVQISQVLSFIAAIISNFTWNRYWTYPDSRSKPIYRQIVQFSMVSGTGLLIRTVIVGLLLSPMQRLFETLALPIPLSPDFLGPNLTLASAVVVVMFWNFFVNRYWTYSDVDFPGADPSAAESLPDAVGQSEKV